MTKKTPIFEFLAIFSSFLILIISISELLISLFLFTESYIFSNIQHIPDFLSDFFYAAHTAVRPTLLFAILYLFMGTALLCAFIANMIKFIKFKTATGSRYILSKIFSISSFALLIITTICCFWGLADCGILVAIVFGLVNFFLYLAHIFTISILFCVNL